MLTRRFSSALGVGLSLTLSAGLLVGPGAGVARAEYPAGGVDSFDSRAQVFVAAEPLCVGATASTPGVVSAVVDGPTSVKRSDPVTPEDGRQVIDTEIIQLQLAGTTPLGPLAIRQNPDRPSTGQVRQQDAGLDFPADSFFDVFVEVEVAGTVLENRMPVHMENVINSLPPDTFPYLPPPGTCIPLFPKMLPIDVPVLWLIHAEHLPQPSRDCFVVDVHLSGTNDTTSGFVNFSAGGRLEVVRGKLSPMDDENALAEVLRFDLVGGGFGFSPPADSHSFRFTASDPPRLGSFGRLTGQEFPAQSFFDVFLDVSLFDFNTHEPIGGVLPPQLVFPLNGPYDPQGLGTFDAEWTQGGWNYELHVVHTRAADCSK